MKVIFRDSGDRACSWFEEKDTNNMAMVADGSLFQITMTVTIYCSMALINKNERVNAKSRLKCKIIWYKTFKAHPIPPIEAVQMLFKYVGIK